MPLDAAAAVVSNRALSSDYNVLTLAAPAIAALAEPGQFVMVKAGRRHDPLLRRPFSLFEILRTEHGAPAAFSLLNKRIGPSTSLLYHAAPGDTVDVLGPLGRAFTIVEPPQAAWLVAGGVGLAPFATLAEVLTARGVSTTLFYGARRAAELFYLDVFERLGVELVLTTEDGSRGEHGRVVAPLDRRLAARDGADAVTVYACGPEGMLRAVAAAAAKHQRPCEVSVERIMGCGMGGCYSCVVPVRLPGGAAHHVRACLEGPVFDGTRIAW
jgi:dihydroorotate dehydrogenase electron transfer subunit